MFIQKQYPAYHDADRGPEQILPSSHKSLSWVYVQRDIFFLFKDTISDMNLSIKGFPFQHSEKLLSMKHMADFSQR